MKKQRQGPKLNSMQGLQQLGIHDCYLSQRLAVSYTGKCKDTLRKHFRNGELPRYKTAGKISYKKSDLDRCMELHKETYEKFDVEKKATEALEKLRRKLEEAS